jgi:predicted Rossmann-fold nucleotide-binding protein
MLQDGTLNQDKIDYIDFVETPEEIFEAIEKVENRLIAAEKVGHLSKMTKR